MSEDRLAAQDDVLAAMMTKSNAVNCAAYFPATVTRVLNDESTPCEHK